MFKLCALGAELIPNKQRYKMGIQLLKKQHILLTISSHLFRPASIIVSEVYLVALESNAPRL